MHRFLPKNRRKRCIDFSKESFGVNEIFIKRLKKSFFNLPIAHSKTFLFSKIPLLRRFRAKKQNRNFVSKLRFSFGGEGGIRTHVPVKANAFRVRPVMTASILLQILNFYMLNPRIWQNIKLRQNLGQNNQKLLRYKISKTLKKQGFQVTRVLLDV